MRAFRCQAIARLRHELALAPLRQRLRQVEGIGRALSLIEPGKEYPYAFVCYHITGYQPRETDEPLLDGENLIEDLITLADRLTLANPIPVGAERGRLYGLEALAARFSVSARTISRWRRRGLLGCWYGSGEGGPRVMFPSRAVQCFVTRHLDLVRRGSAFRVMGDQERNRLIGRARELVATERGSLHSVAARLAAECDRAVETIRLLLRKHDHEHSGEALFDRLERAAPIDENEVIFQARSVGATVRQLAERFDRTEADIQGILATVRAKRFASAPFKYVHNESFDAPDAETEILASWPAASEPPDDEVGITLSRAPTGLPAYLRDLYRTPLLSAAEEVVLFRRMNYLLHRAELKRRIVSGHSGTATEEELDAVQRELDRANEVRQRIAQANLRLVVSIAKRHLRGRSVDLFELVSDGNIALMRAVASFDYARGFRFSTYASWVIMREFARSVPIEAEQADRFRTGREEILVSLNDHREGETSHRSDRLHLRCRLAECLAQLDDRERQIVERRYGVGAVNRTVTLAELGSEFGISRERVRQIELRALGKLRRALGDGAAALLAG